MRVIVCDVCKTQIPASLWAAVYHQADEERYEISITVRRNAFIGEQMEDADLCAGCLKDFAAIYSKYPQGEESRARLKVFDERRTAGEAQELCPWCHLYVWPQHPEEHPCAQSGRFKAKKKMSTPGRK